MLRPIIEQHVPRFLLPGELTFLSDRQKGLIEGVQNIFPDSAHGYCLKHLQANFHKKFKNKELSSLLWAAATATTLEKFEEALTNMDGIDPRAKLWLLDHASPEHWAEIFFVGRRYGHFTSNIAESLNSWLLEAREKPILPMFEQIRHQLMGWFAERRGKESTTQTLLVSNVANDIKAALNTRARRYRFLESTPVEFEVLSKETNRNYIVKFDTQTCTCLGWQSTGIPCSHALVVIIHRQENPHMFAKSFFRLESYRKTYENAIFAPSSCQDIVGPLRYHPRDEDEDESVELDTANALLPPSTRRGPGAPKKRRFRTEVDRFDAEGRVIPRRLQHCSRCGGVGHSRPTCNEAI